MGSILFPARPHCWNHCRVGVDHRPAGQQARSRIPAHAREPQRVRAFQHGSDLCLRRVWRGNIGPAPVFGAGHLSDACREVLSHSSRMSNAGCGMSQASRRGLAPAMGFTPWNRPPLPTYAAALAQSGYGTGDVEDNLIAQPPPPAYGNTRDSTLLLSAAQPDRNAQFRPRMIETIPESRPVSYMTIDVHREEREDAARARMLEETLARLEDNSNLNAGTSGH